MFVCEIKDDTVVSHDEAVDIIMNLENRVKTVKTSTIELFRGTHPFYGNILICLDSIGCIGVISRLSA